MSLQVIHEVLASTRRGVIKPHKQRVIFSIEMVPYSMELNERSNVSNKVRLAMAAGTVPVKELLPSCRPCKASALLSRPVGTA